MGSYKTDKYITHNELHNNYNPVFVPFYIEHIVLVAYVTVLHKGNNNTIKQKNGGESIEKKRNNIL